MRKKKISEHSLVLQEVLPKDIYRDLYSRVLLHDTRQVYNIILVYTMSVSCSIVINIHTCIIVVVYSPTMTKY